jgi:RimJ/RimL family protein N-acetyltransferase
MRVAAILAGAEQTRSANFGFNSSTALLRINSRSSSNVTKAFHMHMDPLIGPRITLRPMLASDGRDLVQAASDGDLWKLPFTVVPSAETIDSYIRVALDGRADGTAIPYVIQLHQIYEPKRLIIGSTRFWKIDWQNRNVEIGWTWLAKSWQRTFVNTEAKYLMRLFAFVRLYCIRVQLMTDETNEISCAAILRLGAKQEGIIRQDFIMPNGRKRDSVLFSIIDEEWPEVRRNLEERLKGPAEPELRRNPVD